MANRKLICYVTAMSRGWRVVTKGKKGILQFWYYCGKCDASEVVQMKVSLLINQWFFGGMEIFFTTLHISVSIHY